MPLSRSISIVLTFSIWYSHKLLRVLRPAYCIEGVRDLIRLCVSITVTRIFRIKMYACVNASWGQPKMWSHVICCEPASDLHNTYSIIDARLSSTIKLIVWWLMVRKFQVYWFLSSFIYKLLDNYHITLLSCSAIIEFVKYFNNYIQ